MHRPIDGQASGARWHDAARCPCVESRAEATLDRARPSTAGETAITTQPRADASPADDIRGEAERLSAAVRAAGLRLRLMGGMAIWLTSPSVRRPPFARAYADLDFAAASADRKRVVPFFEGEGYLAERLFNKLHGAQRLNFVHPSGRWTIDVVYDELNMSHRIDLRDRLGLPGPTLDLADLLLTKLQIWEINEKDLRDVACLLADHALADAEPVGDPSAIDVRRILALTSTEWGLCHTVERNLGRVEAHAGGWSMADAPFGPAAQARALLDRIAGAPKSLAWRARARVGERVRWYETPEEVRHEVADSEEPLQGSGTR